MLSAAGVPEGVVTLEATNPSYNLSGMSRSVSVAPNGDFYRAPTSFFSGGDTIHPAYILQWKAEGSFTRVHNGATNGSLTGFDVFFALDGTALTLARDHERGVFGIVPVDNTTGKPLVPLPVAHESASRRVQTDAAGNLYVSTPQAPAGRATTRTDPPPMVQYIRKFSPAGVELAAVRFASYAVDEPFAVGADGTVFAASGTGLRVYKRTR